MSINSFFQFFVPKERKFYPLYMHQAENIELAAKALDIMIGTTEIEPLESYKKEIKSYEQAGDAVLKDFFTTLDDTVLCPFERNDMHALAELMDNILDRIDDCANIILTRRFLDLDNDLNTMTHNIMHAAENLSCIIKNLEYITTSKGDEIARLCNEIKEIEHKNDELYGLYINKLFTNHFNLVEIIKRKDLVQVLENATNAMKYASDKIRSMQAKLC